MNAQSSIQHSLYLCSSSADAAGAKNASSSKYKGISFNKVKGKYYACKKKCNLGSYFLESDAAWSVDEYSRQLGLSKVNFTNSSYYHKARKKEMEERELELPLSEVEAYMAGKLNETAATSTMCAYNGSTCKSNPR